MSMERRKNLTMTKEMIDLKELLTNIIEQQKLKADKPCEIFLECQEDATVEADPTHFSNVIGNLIDNSIKYSGESVNIIIKADAKGVSIADNGIGIPEKSLRVNFRRPSSPSPAVRTSKPSRCKVSETIIDNVESSSTNKILSFIKERL